MPALFLIEAIRERGPLTVAALMDLALYHPQLGYYTRAARRSGRAGDFFTSVDVGPLFGELLETQLAEMAGIVDAARGSDADTPVDLVEAGAGNGQLAADILRAARRRHPAFYRRLRLHLVELSEPARRAQPATLGDTKGRLASSSTCLLASFEGVLLANELLDALPVHQVVMREDGLREVYVDVTRAPHSRARLIAVEGPPSTPALGKYLDRIGAILQPGWRAEINLRALDWIRDAARRLRRGFMILVDYGHAARELYSARHAQGTLTAFAGHTMTGQEEGTAWLAAAGESDLTAHVDFTSVQRAAEDAGLVTLGLLDQMYFLLGLVESGAWTPAGTLAQRLALKTLVLPGGLGSTMKVLVLGKHVGEPALAGCSYRVRIT